MAGTRRGARKAVKTKLRKYGRNHFKKVGKLGGNPILLKTKHNG